MLRSAHELMGYRIQASDGQLGKVYDFLFDDRSWVVRYIAVDTGNWLPGRLVLVSPVEAGQPQWGEHVLPVSLTRQQVEDSPPIEAHLPISRQQEMLLADYYGWVPYWGPTAPVMSPIPVPTTPPQDRGHVEPHLRSLRDIRGYHIRATDEAIGHVSDFVIDTESWAIRYAVADTRNWLPGKKVLLAPQWIQSVDWANKLVCLDHTREQMLNSPQFDPSSPVNREYEERLYDYYGRPAYWPPQEAKVQAK